MTSNITVLLINHNYSQYIDDAIKSCFTQTRLPYCVITIDDASDDNGESWNKICKYFDKPQIIEENGLQIWREQVNNVLMLAVRLPQCGGPSLARNIGIDITKSFTTYYQILDSDDFMFDRKLEILSDKMESDPAIGVVYADYNILNVETGIVLREWKKPYQQRLMMSGECIVHSGSMIRTEKLLSVMESTGYYDRNLRCAEDLDLWLRLSERSVISHVPTALTLVRVHKKNSTFSVDKQVWERCWARVSQKSQERQNK